MLGAIDGARAVVEAAIEPHAVGVGEAAMVGKAHMALLAADRGLAALQARTLAGIEPSAVDAFSDALLLVFLSLVDGDGVALHRLRCGLSKTNG